jgi:hypothetical protein
MTSESTRFFGHPRLTMCTFFPMGDSPLRYLIISKGIDIDKSPKYGSVKPNPIARVGFEI